VLTNLILGATYAFAAAAQPGPYQTYLISQALSHGWRRTLPAALAPVVSDVPIIVVVVVLLSRLPVPLLDGLRCGGGVFLLYLAWRAVGAWRRPRMLEPAAAPSAPRTFWAAVAIDFLNPNPWLGWSLVLGPLLLAGWRTAPADGMGLLAGFYVTLVAASAGIVVLFAGARRLGPRVSHALVGASAAGLALFGCWQLWTGTAGLLRV
jgi:threonine/homoserine/homoserine lactone efflux protein